MDEKEYGIDHVSIRRGLDNTFLVVECGGEYTEDYQMRMLEENDMGGILCPRGHGEEGISMYEYDISGKISLKSKYKEMKIDMKEMIKFITGLLDVVREIHDHLLDADHLLLDPEYIFWEDGAYFFCYYPGGGWNVWEAFHRLTEQFVQWTDFRDDASVRTSFLLHKETMKENYSLHKIARQLEDMQEEEAKRKRGGEDPGSRVGPVGRTGGMLPEGSSQAYDSSEHDWIAKQEAGSIMRETENMWRPVRDFLRRHKKPGWRDWDGIYIDEEEL